MKILRYILLASLTCVLSACEKDEILPEPEPPVVTPGDDPGKDEEEKIQLGITASLQAMQQTRGIIGAEMALIDTDVRRTFATGIAGFSHVVDSLSAIKYAKVKVIRDEDGIAALLRLSRR